MAYSGSAQDRLDAVRLAIANTLASQSISSRSGSQTMASLDTLYRMEQTLIREVQMAGSNGGSMCTLGMQTPPS